MEKVGFSLNGFYIGVDTFLLGDELSVLQFERILPVGPLVVGIYRQAGTFSKALPMAEGRSEVTEGTSSHLNLRESLLSVFESRLFRFDVQDSCRCKESGRLKHIVIVSDSQRERRHIVERESTDIYLSGLRIADSHSVVTYCRMCRPEVSHRYGLDTAYTTIVAHIGTGKAFHRIAHVLQSQVLQVFLAEHLYGGCRRDFGRHTSGCHGHGIQVLYVSVDTIFRYLSIHR